MTKAAARAEPARTSRYPEGARRLRDRLAEARRTALKPPEDLSVSTWADRHAYLSAETSADAGKFTAFAYQNGMMDAVSDPSVQRVTVMKSARVGYTKMLDHIVAFFIAHDPAPILLVQPRVEDAEDYSRTELAPMLRDTPVLAAIAGDQKAKDSGQRILKRMFRNGASVALVGANSPGGFRRITARIILFDEVDGYPAGGAGEEGDQIALGIKRSETFWNRRIVLGSTPTVEGVSRIEKSWKESDQRRYFVPCPECGHRQVLRWENLKWDRDEAGDHLPETAYFRCESEAGCRIEEHHKPAMIDAGEWVAAKPSKGHAGFHIWAAYSLFPNASWGNLAAEWLRVYKDPLQKRAFVNLVRGEPHAEAVEVADPDRLRARCEPYNHETLPEGVRLVTFGADTQDDRIEVTFVGWGLDGEAWIARHEVVHGDTSKPLVWQTFDRLIVEPLGTDDGRSLIPQAGVIDSQGHRSAMVYDFCRRRRNRRIYAGNGVGNSDPARPRMIWPKTASRTKNSGDKPYPIGVDTAKDDLTSRLAIVPDPNGPTARAIHFPAIGLSADYFEQLTSEHAVTSYVNNQPKRRWVTKRLGARNEAWDCLVYALAARLSLPNKLESKKPARRGEPPPPEPDTADQGPGEGADEAPRAEAEPDPAETEPDGDPDEPKSPPARAGRVRRKRWGNYG